MMVMMKVKDVSFNLFCNMNPPPRPPAGGQSVSQSAGLIGWLICQSRGGRRDGLEEHAQCGGGGGVQLRWKPFSMVAASRRSLMMSSEEYSGSFR